MLSGQAGSFEQVPTLDLAGQGDLVAGDLAIGLIMVGHEGQQALLTLPLEVGEVVLEVIRQEDAIVILKVAVQAGQDLAEGIFLLAILDREVLEEAPDNSGE